MIEIILMISITINIFLIWYSRNTLTNLLFLSENLGLLYEIINDFTLHLQRVYELERFYGDPTLTNLLEHSKAVTEELEKYEEIFLLSEPLQEEEDLPDGEEETQEN